MADLPGADLTVADIHKLYECHEHWLDHKQELFTHLTAQWKDLFNAKFDVLLYDLTPTYFESDPPCPDGDKRRHEYPAGARLIQTTLAIGTAELAFTLNKDKLREARQREGRCLLRSNITR